MKSLIRVRERGTSIKNIGECQKLWARHKYLVLSKSHRQYLEIREYLKEESPELVELKRKIAMALELEESRKDCANAYQHVWGYFKRCAIEQEKREFFNLLEDYVSETCEEEDLRRLIEALLLKYPNEYLQKSSLIERRGR